MTEDTSADDGREHAADAVEERETRRGASGGAATGEGSADAQWHPNEPVPAELRDGVDDELRETVASDLADLEEDEPEYPSSDDPVEPQRVDVENAAFVVLGVVAVLALVAVLLLGL